MNDALLRAEFKLPTDCGGMGPCGRCQVELRPIAAVSSLGMLPAENRLGAIEVLPNAAGAGAVMVLLDTGKRRRTRGLGCGMRVIELKLQADVNERFIQALSLPHQPRKK
ncbi:MAG: DUF4445 domain-containing protein [Proteobacteria bacterium]|nr:DUF4445 domain-containing protein [Pseudomonadota bacterium]MBU1451360.1 DUF4445 domain-containing protein [Pseudomonadota bacterium]MBU2469519.1 DUF4445 domain-containing protein [Pseudomonadota bacterium]MBU2517340.1 DUF4445 domain-containing protein [Pseudomonadota bacterium]